MIGVGVGGMRVAVVMFMTMAMRMVMTVVVMVVMGLPRQDFAGIDGEHGVLLLPRHCLAHLVADAVAICAVLGGANALYVVMVTFLHGANISLEPQNLCAIFAHLAVHGDVTSQDLVNALGKGGDNLRMVVEVGRLDEFDLRMARSNGVRCIIDAIDEDAGEEEVREHHDAAVAEARGMLEAGINQRKGDAGIGRLRPAEAKAFPQQTRDLGDVGVGVRVGSAAADND